MTDSLTAVFRQFLLIPILLVACFDISFAQNSEPLHVKCATPAIQLSPKTSKPLFFDLPFQYADSLLSPSGRFMIYYSTAGDSLPADNFANYAALLADSAYDFEVTTLGYPAPAFTTNGHYNLYLAPLHSDPVVQAYGATFPQSPLGVSPSGLPLDRSYIIVDNAFTSSIYATQGYDALRITIFHEFFHLIQFADFGTNLDPNQNSYFNELSSVWMEMESTPAVKDYLILLPVYLSSLEDRFDKSPSGGYGQGIFFSYLTRRFGSPDIIKEIWTDYSNLHSDPLSAIEAVLERHGTTFCQTYRDFGAELFYAGRRFRGTSELPDAGDYPVDQILYHNISGGISGNVLGFAASLEYFIAGFNSDSCAVVVARDTNRLELGTGTVTIDAPATYHATYSDPTLFCDTLLCSEPSALFPNPFFISANSIEEFNVLASAKPARPISTTFDIYSSAFAHIFHSDAKAQPRNGGWNAIWNGRDDIGALVTSGIYLYTLEVDGLTTSGKFVVIRN